MCTVDEDLNQLKSGELSISLNPVWQRLHEDGCEQWVDQLQQQCVDALRLLLASGADAWAADEGGRHGENTFREHLAQAGGTVGGNKQPHTPF